MKTDIILKEHFPEIKRLYPYQKKVLEMLNKQKNVLSIIPTGGGKSLIFQLFGLTQPGLTLVVSPLVALMKEQVDELVDREINSIAFNANISFSDQRELLRNIKKLNYKFIYVSPERLQNTFFRASMLSSGIHISQLVIDEAHCISEWGGDFRPDYGQIPGFIERLNKLGQKPVVYTLTATLAKETRKAIQKAFGITESSTYVHQDILRQNLKLEFIKVEDEKQKENELNHFLLKYKPKKALTYLYSIPKCEKFSQKFSLNRNTDYFHSKVDSEEKANVYLKFKKGEIDMLFATTAFGMGINIPDIDAIIQIQIPHSVEEYYQQVGRGWRDKNKEKVCNCLTLWSDKNFYVQEESFEDLYIDSELFDKMLISLIGKKLNAGMLVNISFDKLNNSTFNLKLFKHKLENKGIIKTIAEVNGSPLTIELKNTTSLWTKIQNAASEFDSFKYVIKTLELEPEAVFDYLFEQELQNNIKKIPSTKKDCFFKVNVDEISAKIKEEIIAEINKVADYKIENLKQLKNLFQSKDPESQIKKLLMY